MLLFFLFSLAAGKEKEKIDCTRAGNANYENPNWNFPDFSKCSEEEPICRETQHPNPFVCGVNPPLGIYPVVVTPVYPAPPHRTFTGSCAWTFYKPNGTPNTCSWRITVTGGQSGVYEVGVSALTINGNVFGPDKPPIIHIPASAGSWVLYYNNGYAVNDNAGFYAKVEYLCDVSTPTPQPVYTQSQGAVPTNSPRYLPTVKKTYSCYECSEDCDCPIGKYCVQQPFMDTFGTCQSYKEKLGKSCIPGSASSYAEAEREVIADKLCSVVEVWDEPLFGGGSRRRASIMWDGVCVAGKCRECKSILQREEWNDDDGSNYPDSFVGGHFPGAQRSNENDGFFDDWTDGKMGWQNEYRREMNGCSVAPGKYRFCQDNSLLERGESAGVAASAENGKIAGAVIGAVAGFGLLAFGAKKLFDAKSASV